MVVGDLNDDGNGVGRIWFDDQPETSAEPHGPLTRSVVFKAVHSGGSGFDEGMPIACASDCVYALFESSRRVASQAAFRSPRVIGQNLVFASFPDDIHSGAKPLSRLRACGGAGLCGLALALLAVGECALELFELALGHVGG